MIRRILETLATVLIMAAWSFGAFWLAGKCGLNPLWGLVAVPFCVLALPITMYVSDVYCGGDKRISS
jgi:hypothetical protein